ncbi:hypothetical protein V7O66_05090 [Methanolobus sp. ZRKC3]|uniref:hypothetical protein n=1 Tax=Methanolobus sp. ZRKC3 TaxID=3125786 RepID=UPI0032477371
MYNTNHNFVIGDFDVWSKAVEKKDKIIISGNITNNGIHANSLVLYVSMHERDGANIYDGEWRKDQSIFKDESNRTLSKIIASGQTEEFQIELNEIFKARNSLSFVNVEKYQIHLYNGV